MKGYDKPALPVELVSFAMDGWGTTLRYDFSQDIGDTITAINLSPDMKKIMIVKGEITGCDNYLVPECKLAVRYKVADTQHFHDCQSMSAITSPWFMVIMVIRLLLLPRLWDWKS